MARKRKSARFWTRSCKANCARTFASKPKRSWINQWPGTALKFVMIDAAVTVSGLTNVFPVPFHREPVVAVRHLDLRIQAGDVYGLLGPNGSGKSITLQSIVGVVAPTHARTEIFVRDSSLVESREAVGFLPENPYFYKYLTGEETLRFFGKLCGLSGSRLRERSDQLLELVGLTNARDRRLSTYSKGMLQRIGLAQALIHEPKLLVLDEPTGGVDPAGSRDIRNLIVDLKQRGITVLLSSQLLEQAPESCYRVGILADGVLVREGSLEELIAIENQTELILENASDALVDRINTLATSSNAKLIARRRSTTTLERLFLDATSEDSNK